MRRALPDPCPHGWSYRSGACYRVVNKDTADFKIAQKYCRYIGGEVVKITSKEENNYVLDLAKRFAPDLTKLWINIQRDCDNNKLSIGPTVLSSRTPTGTKDNQTTSTKKRTVLICT